MPSNQEALRQSQPRGDSRDVRGLTLRLPIATHELIESAAEATSKSLNQFIVDAAQTAAANVLGEDHVADTNVAIFVDLDAFVGGAPVDVAAIERAVALSGRSVVKSCFGTPAPFDQGQARQAFVTHHFRSEEVASRDALRLRLAMEALRAVSTATAQVVIIVSNDEHFAFLSSLLMREGARVIGIAVRPRTETGSEYMKAFDAFRFYEQIVRPPESEDVKKLKKQYAEYLVQAVFDFERRGVTAVGAAISPIVKDRHPDVSLSLAGVRSWRELAEIAKDLGLVAAVERNGADFRVTLSDQGRSTAEAHIKAREGTLTQLEEIGAIRRKISETLGIEIPDAGVRFLVFNTMNWVLYEGGSSDGISLIDLSNRVAARLESSAVTQNTAYRLLYGLFLSRSLEFRPNAENKRDPWILRARIPVMNFDDAFVLNLLLVQKLTPATVNIEQLSTVLYGSPAHREKVSFLLAIAADPQFDRSSLPGRLAKIPTGARM